MTSFSPVSLRSAAAGLGALLVFSASSLQAAGTDNLVVNGDFETPLGADWKVMGDPRMITIEKEDGNQFLSLHPADPAYASVVQRFPVGQDWTGIRVVGRVRVANLQKGPEGHNTATLVYSFEDAGGQHVGEWSQNMIMKDQDWTEVSGEVPEIPAGAVTLVVQCAMMNAAGTADFDDIVVTPEKASR